MNNPMVDVALDFEVTEIERASRPGCNSSSTNPRCTCPVRLGDDD
jgi:hypothetical protein